MGPNRIPLDIWWKLCVLVIFSVVGIASQFISGEGVQARLDASDGAGSDNFRASMVFNFQELSDPQLANLNWALQQLHGDELQRRYGDRPTVREVVLGELMRAADPLHKASHSSLASPEDRASAAKAMKSILDNKAWF
jgi:hypothetical protein